MSKSRTVEERLSVIEVEIKHSTKNIDKLVLNVERLLDNNVQLATFNSRINAIEEALSGFDIHRNKKDLIVWGALIAAILGLTIDRFI